jgi:hypothetical protein
LLGQFEIVFWFDDGIGAGIWKQQDLDQLRWYLDYNTNLMLTGWRTAFELAGLSADEDLTPGNLLYDYAGVTHVLENQDVDLVGALGEAGYPNVALDPDKVYSFWDGKMGWIGMLQANPSAEVIYRFDSHSGAADGQILGVRRQNNDSKFAFLSLPTYYLVNSDVQALIAAMLSWFESGPPCDCSATGDCNDDGTINPIDIVYMINYVLRMIGPPPPADEHCPLVNRGDFDCSGTVMVNDIVKMVNYVYRFPAPGPCDPCAE